MILRPKFNLTKAERCLNNLSEDLRRLFNLLAFSHPSYAQLKQTDPNFDKYSADTATEVTNTWDIIKSAKALKIYQKEVDYIFETVLFLCAQTGQDAEDTKITISVNTREFSLLVRAVIYAVQERKTYGEIFGKIIKVYKGPFYDCLFHRNLFIITSAKSVQCSKTV